MVLLPACVTASKSGTPADGTAYLKDPHSGGRGDNKGANASNRDIHQMPTCQQGSDIEERQDHEKMCSGVHNAHRDQGHRF